MLFIGGRRSPIGAVIGALVIQYLQGASNWVSVNILIVEGVLLTVVLLVDPEGLSGIVATAIAWLRGKSGPAAPRSWQPRNWPAGAGRRGAGAASRGLAGRGTGAGADAGRRSRPTPGREAPGETAGPARRGTRRCSRCAASSRSTAA